MTLHQAAIEGCVEKMVELLEEHSGNINEIQDGWSPLHLAAHFGHKEVIQVLLNRGANIHIQSGNEMKNTPLHTAAANKENRREIMDMLLSYGARINEKQSGGWTVLHQAAHHNDAEMVLYYLEKGADWTAVKEDGKTALALAQENQCMEAVEALKRYTVPTT